jgi:hypothetical protein
MARFPSAAREPLLVSSAVLVAEHYLAGDDPRRAETLTRLLRASDRHFRHALFVPADETYFAVYDGPSPEAPRTATAIAARSCSPFDRVVRGVLLES